MKVSILTSVYNKAPWLSRWFDCVCGQTFKNIEIVVINNASTDNSSEVITEYAAKDNRIKVITLKKNIGPAGGYSTAIRNATGDYFTFADADDFIDKNYIQILYDEITQNDADMSMCVNDIIYPNGSIWHKPWPKKNKYIIEGNDIKLLPCQLLDELSNKYLGFYMPEMGAIWNKMFKKSIVDENHIDYNPALWIWCDFDFGLRYIWHVKKVVFTTDTVYHFYQSENSLTRAAKFNISKILYVLDALDCIDKQLDGRLFKELQHASYKFYFLRMRDVCNDLYFHKDMIPSSDYDKVNVRILNSVPFQKLCNTQDLSFLTAKEKVYLKLIKKGHLKEAVFFSHVCASLSWRFKKLIGKI